MDSNPNRIATLSDFQRAAAARWLGLPGIESFPKFRRICAQIIERDDQWIRGNWNRIEAMFNSDRVRLFLVKQRQLSWFGLLRASNAKNPRLRREAQKALDEFHASIECAELGATVQSMADQQGQFAVEELRAVGENLALQPAVVKEPLEFDRLLDLAFRGRYSDLDRYLDRCLAEVKSWWKQKLGVPSHRKAPRSTRFTYFFAYNLRKQGRSWSEVARHAAPEAYKADPKRAVDRIKKAVKALLKQSPQVDPSPAGEPPMADEACRLSLSRE